MATEIEINADLILRHLIEVSEQKKSMDFLSGQEIQKATGLESYRINQAVEFLKSRGLIEWLLTIGSAPFTFYCVKLTSRGQYEFERKEWARKLQPLEPQKPQASIEDVLSILSRQKPPVPVGVTFWIY